MDASLKAKLEKIKLFLMDVDGTLTDGGIYIGPDGHEWKKFHVLDGLGISLAHRAGIITGLISGRFSQPVQYRAQSLGIKEVYMGTSDKLGVLHALLEKYRLAPVETAFIGDDILDIPILKSVGVKFAVANAMPPVMEIADIRTKAAGGSGAVREAIEIILKAQGKWDELVSGYLQERWSLAQ